jgi:hypothetical protein
MLILVDQPTEDLSASYPHLGQVGNRVRDDVAGVWRTKAPGQVRAMAVAVLVLH